VILWEKNDQANQQWTVVPVPANVNPITSSVVSNGRYVLRNAMTQRVLELTTEGRVVCSTHQIGKLGQTWDIRIDGTKSYQIINAIDDTGSTYFAYAKPDQHNHVVGSKDFRAWVLTSFEGSNNTFFISTGTAAEGGLYVDLAAANVSEEGCQALLWPYIGRTNQQWVLEPDPPVKTNVPFKPILQDSLLNNVAGTIEFQTQSAPVNKIVRSSSSGDHASMWEFKRNADGSYYIQITYPGYTGWASYAADNEGSYLIFERGDHNSFIVRRHATRPKEFYLLSPGGLVVEFDPNWFTFTLVKTIKDSPLQLWNFPV